MHPRTFSRTAVAVMTFAVLALSTMAASADEVKVPETAADHEAMAKSYKDEAAQFKKVADDHRAMVEAYKKTLAMPVSKTGQKHPWLVKMEKHCEMLAKDADKLAADAEKAADFHTMRAKELQGK